MGDLKGSQETALRERLKKVFRGTILLDNRAPKNANSIM